MIELSNDTSQVAIWQAFDRVRGKVSASEFGQGLAALVFLRWVDFQDAEQEAIAAFDDADYRPVLPRRLHWRNWHNAYQNVKKEVFTELPDRLGSLANSRSDNLATQLHCIAPAVETLASFPIAVIENLIRWLAAQPFETPGDRRTLRDTLDNLTKQLVDKQTAQYFTPRNVVETMVAVADPKFGESVYDPCFGSAGMLTSALDFVRENDEKNARSGKPMLELSGGEKFSENYVIGLTRLVLSGVADPQLELGNSLERVGPSSPKKDGFDLVLMNPPWGAKVEPHGLDHYPIPTNNAVSLFVQHALAQLRPTGRAIAVIPQGFLFSGGREKSLREMILREHTVDAVVSMPKGSFVPYTNVNSCLLVFRKGGTTKSVRMVDLSDEKFGKSSSAEELISNVVELVKAPFPEDQAWDVDFATLEEYDFDLTPKRRNQSSLEEIIRGFGGHVELQPLREVCSISAGKSVPSKSLENEKVTLTEAPRHREEIGSDIKNLQTEILEFDETNPVERREIQVRLKQIEQLTGELDYLDYSEDHEIPYIRIKDVSKGQVSSGSAWVAKDYWDSIKKTAKLTLGDLLVSKSGTIGKSGIVRNGAIGGVASSGFFVVRAKNKSHVDPNYLLAYLNSSECSDWLDERARGSAMKHLSIKSFKELPVPIPPIQIQQRVGAEYRESGADAIDLMGRFLLGQETNPVAAWLSETSARVSSSRNSSKSWGFGDWEKIARELKQFRNESAHSTVNEAGLLDMWIVQFDRALSPLVGAGKIPDASSRWTVLNESLQRSTASLEFLTNETTPASRNAISINRYLIDWLESQSESLVKESKLSVVCSTTELTAGDRVELVVDIENKGTLPLRNLEIFTRPEGWAKDEVDFLAGGGKHQLILDGQSPSQPSEFNIEVHWTALTLNGEAIEGTREIGFSVVAGQHKTELVGELGGSPYICGDPVKTDRNEMFVGRDELIGQIRRQVIESGNVVLLEGNRRAGKSSVLWHLEGDNPIPGWLGVYCSLQGIDGATEGGIPTADVFRGMAYDIVQAIRNLNGTAILPDGSTLDPARRLGINKSVRTGISDDAPFQDFREYLEMILETLAEQDLGLLLMMDEFDKLQEGIDNGVTSPQVPENIRFLVQSLPKFSAILTGSRRLKRMRQEYWSALFGLGTRLGVTALPFEAASRLILEPVKGRLSFSTSAVKLAAKLTSRQPYLLQCLCNRIFDIAAETDVRSITVVHVEEAAARLVEDNEHFASLWDYTEFERRRFLLFLLHREENGPDQMRLPVIAEMLSQLGIELGQEVLMSDLEYLRELELIDMHGEASGTYYELTIPMMGDWLESQQDYNVTLERARAESEDIREKVQEYASLKGEIHELENELDSESE